MCAAFSRLSLLTMISSATSPRVSFPCTSCCSLRLATSLFNHVFKIRSLTAWPASLAHNLGQIAILEPLHQRQLNPDSMLKPMPKLFGSSSASGQYCSTKVLNSVNFNTCPLGSIPSDLKPALDRRYYQIRQLKISTFGLRRSRMLFVCIWVAKIRFTTFLCAKRSFSPAPRVSV